MNAKLISSDKISKKFAKHGMSNFMEACDYVKNLPYKRNKNKSDILGVFSDQGGTCSTKHALLKDLALENKLIEVKLMLCIFKMNSQNTPRISRVLNKYALQEIPEAHNYLIIENKIMDCTHRNSKPENFINDLIEEIEIEPGQITDFKIEFHKNYLQKYLHQNPEIKYSPQEFWQIREECIAALQQ